MSHPGPTQEQLEMLWRDSTHWHLGLLYYAPADPRVFVPKRGSTWMHQTLNWARPASWGIALVCVLPVFLVAAFALWVTR